MEIVIRIPDVNVHLHVHEHGVGSDAITKALMRIERILQLIKKDEERNMALNQESLDLLARLDTATSKIAQKLNDLINNPNTTQEEFRAALAPLAEQLDAMAADPADPVPPDPVDPNNPQARRRP